MKKNILFIILLSVVFQAQAKEYQGTPSSFGMGISTGSITGTGIDVTKYFGDYFVQGSIMLIYQAEGDSFNDYALSAGKYLGKEEVLSFDMPIGFKVVGGVNLTDDGELRKAVGFGVDLFNPGARGVSAWFNITYGTPGYVDNFTFYPATGIMYNF